MKKQFTIASAVLGFSMMAQAQLTGIGYDAGLSQVTARLALGANAIDVGVGLKYDGKDDNNDDNNFAFGASGFFLGHLHDWSQVDTYFVGGLIFNKLPQKNDNLAISLFAGLQPEVTVFERLILSTRFGLDVPVAPDVVIQTAGQGVSIVGAANFKILL